MSKEYKDDEHGVEDTRPLREIVDKAIRYSNGDSFIMEETGEHVLVCCDCGLTHKIEIEKMEDQQSLKISTWRSDELSRMFRESDKHSFPFNPLKQLSVVDEREDSITKVPEAVVEYIVIGKHFEFMGWCSENKIKPNDPRVIHCRDIEEIKGINVSRAVAIPLESSRMDLVSKVIKEVNTAKQNYYGSW